MRWRPSDRIRAWVQGAGSILLFLLVWEGAVAVGLVDARLLPTPWVIFWTAVDMFQTGMLQADVRASTIRALTGFFFGSAVGLFMGTLTGRVPIIRGLFEPIIQLFRPVPSIAFVPLAVLWFGLGELPKLVLVAYGVFFPVWLNTHTGVSTVDLNYLRAARMLGCSERRLFVSVILPAVVPFVITGLRYGIGVSYVVLVAAEMTGALAGVGYRIQQSHMIFRADRMITGVVTLGILGFVSDAIFTKLTAPFMRRFET